MRIAVFSDVHGNLTALEAVLEDIALRDIDQVVFAGDLCLVGPRPAECLRRIQSANITSIYGNTDDWILGRQIPPQPLAELAQWTLEQLRPAEQSWLNGLPFSHSISPTNQAQDDFLVVHANPLDVNQLVFPPEEEQMGRYGRIRQSDEELDTLMAAVKAAVLVFGHLHIPNERNWHQLRLINISSVSMPGDGDPRAKYGIFSWQEKEWGFERQFVTYEIEKEVDAYRQSQPPGWGKMVETMQSEGSFPQKV